MKISVLKKTQQLETRDFKKKQRILLNSVSKYLKSQTLSSMFDGQTRDLAPVL